jgi:hypothetical protein
VEGVILLLVLVVVIAAVGIVIGMLVARPLDRWSSRDDGLNEDPGGDDRSDA